MPFCLRIEEMVISIEGQVISVRQKTLLDDLKIATGLFETRINAVTGIPYVVAKSISFALEARQNSLAGMLSDVTDADMADAHSQLASAQLAVQSAAYVFQSLRENSLMKILGG